MRLIGWSGVTKRESLPRLVLTFLHGNAGPTMGLVPR